jgi:hypothetical protein
VIKQQTIETCPLLGPQRGCQHAHRSGRLDEYNTRCTHSPRCGPTSRRMGAARMKGTVGLAYVQERARYTKHARNDKLVHAHAHHTHKKESCAWAGSTCSPVLLLPAFWPSKALVSSHAQRAPLLLPPFKKPNSETREIPKARCCPCVAQNMSNEPCHKYSCTLFPMLDKVMAHKCCGRI